MCCGGCLDQINYRGKIMNKQKEYTRLLEQEKARLSHEEFEITTTARYEGCTPELRAQQQKLEHDINAYNILCNCKIRL